MCHAGRDWDPQQSEFQSAAKELREAKLCELGQIELMVYARKRLLESMEKEESGKSGTVKTKKRAIKFRT